MGKVDTIIASAKSAGKVVMFSKTTCGYCRRAKTLLDSYNASYEAIEINVVDDGPELKSQLIALTGRSTVPNIFVGGENIGGSDDLQALHQQGKLKATLEKANAI